MDKIYQGCFNFNSKQAYLNGYVNRLNNHSFLPYAKQRKQAELIAKIAN